MILKDLRKVAIPPLSSDVYIVSYPKSGNTWLRYILSKCIVEYLQLNRSVNWFNLQEFIPDVEVSQFLPLNTYGSSLPRIIKSHDSYNKHYKRVIYLVRNPLDVMESFYNYENNFEKFSEADFVKSQKGVASWINHFKSWSNNPKRGQIVKFVTYEDMRQDTVNSLFHVCNILGLNLPVEKIEKIVSESGKVEMAEDDMMYNSEMRQFNKQVFIRQEQQKDYFREQFGKQIYDAVNEAGITKRLEFVYKNSLNNIIKY